MTDLKSLLYYSGCSTAVSLALLFLRVVVGLAFLLYGWAKFESPFGWMGPDSVMPGILQALAAVSEVGGGLGWILGFLTRPAALGLCCTMTVATGVHISNGDPFLGPWPAYEHSLSYLAVALLLLAAGPGRFSIDALVFGRPDNTRTDR